MLRFVSIWWILFLPLLISFKTPKFYEGFKKPELAEDELDYMLIEHNSTKKRIVAGQVLPFIFGDQLTIIAAVLRSGKKEVSEVNAVGFAKSREIGTRDDRGLVIDTAEAFGNKLWSVDTDGDVYAIIAASGDILHGAIYVQRQLPKLSYVEIDLNGQSRVLREGEILLVKNSDEIKIKDIESNVFEKGKISFQMFKEKKPSTTQQQRQDREMELRFFYHSKMFARVPILISNPNL